ncbi:MAG: FAD-binding protein [Actinobacteria bacterium]|nr:MAG: FAD-binding protein [Actinomycetota bacterium]
MACPQRRGVDEEIRRVDDGARGCRAGRDLRSRRDDVLDRGAPRAGSRRSAAGRPATRSAHVSTVLVALPRRLHPRRPPPRAPGEAARVADRAGARVARRACAARRAGSRRERARAMSPIASVERELRASVAAEVVAPTAAYLSDETEARGIRGHADAVALPRTAEEVAEVVAWCYAHDVAIVPRGGGTGYAAGAVPLDGGVVLALERLDRVRSFDPLLWRIHVEAGLRTGELRRLGREGGLLFPPDPGAAEQSQIGGNIATNAGGPHAYKYGVTGAWVTGLEVVIAPGEVVQLGGPLTKDVAGYDLKHLLIGSEGTLGVITAAWLRLTPAPEAAWPVVGFFEGLRAGCAAIERVVGSGLPAAALEYLDGETMRYTGATFPGDVPAGAFAVIAEADGSRDEAARVRTDLLDVFGEDALSVYAPETPAEIAALWRWRDGLTLVVGAQRGGKAGEDIAVPLDRLAEAIQESLEIGRRLGLPACSWGHAGDGNLHTTFLVASDDERELALVERASEELFDLALRLGGTISGEHGVGFVKHNWLERQLGPRAFDLHGAVKHVFDPRNLLNPGKKA